ncbi:MAG: tetratricopeptide repeat protein [bacterium]
MQILYRISIEPTEKEKVYRIVWTDVANQHQDHFHQTADEITQEEVDRLWLQSSNQKSIGNKLFGFLDGDAKHLNRALDEAAKQGEPLLLELSVCKSVSDWPFELMAQNGVFLAPGRVHLIRRVSDWGEKKKLQPADRPIRLLFMACSALDVEPELDFEREEETVFRVTEKLAIDMEVEDTGSLEGLREQLEKEPYDIVHLSGHADIDEHGKPFFIMEDEQGFGRDVTPERLWCDALIENPPRLLFLSGCRTGETPEEKAAVSFAHQLIEKHNLPAVLGWGRSVADDQASKAAEVIYHELSRGRDILSAVQRARVELIEHFKSSSRPAWPMLRLYCSGVRHAPIVTEGQKVRPKVKRLVHTYLKNSNVKVLLEGFVGRRRPLQQSLKALKHDPDKVGILLLGTGGLGKSCLAGKICERLSDHTLVVVHGKLNAYTLLDALRDAFILSHDEKGLEILASEKEITDKLAELSAESFMENRYVILLDDFEQNIEGAGEGRPGAPIPEAVPIVKTLLHSLPNCGKMSQMIITSRHPFTLTEQGKDLVKERIEPVSLTSFRRTEQLKKARELKHILRLPEADMATALIAAGRGNPRLMEWMDTLVGEMAESEVSELLNAVGEKHEEFIKTHLIRELLGCAGKETEKLLVWFSVFRLPVQEDGIRLISERAGLMAWKKHAERGMELSLIEYDTARKIYQLTPLLREELWSTVTRSQDKKACHEAAFAYYESVCGALETVDPVLTEEWIYHSLGCGREDVASDKGGNLVSYLRKQLAFLEARHVGEWILAEKKLPPEKGEDASLLNELGSVVHDLGDHKKAIDYYEQALSIDKAVYGDQHPKVAIRLNNLGSVWKALGQKKKAKAYFQEAHAIFLKFYGPDHPSTKTAAEWLED